MEEQKYYKKLLSTAFAQDLINEAELMDRHPTPDHTISLKLKSCISVTTNTNNDNTNFDLKGFVVSLISNFNCFNH